ncbi:hypothetical protein B7P43_G05456 [Cryptotermes secundus]|uniref:USP domain-containing protein n=1 Tax=Cryptotermes secundus TaxID=105785 RepID=A0A2J7R1M5_9NEOP|nr:ubiquitin carboxyl-terminal hydrolase 37 isoform X2 [Cryptotermes secundus]PNF34732.1 hypothetical protein B7P43_G05456 [Cryptotermes secundus]PNF34736.1 hypothetical protein B7P43_G05456 [Cryptotermes secundus]
MTQFSYSSSDNLLAKSHQKASHILGADKMKTSVGLTSRVFYGSNPTASVKSHHPISYMFCSRAVRSSPTAPENGTEFPAAGKIPYNGKRPAEQSAKGQKSALLHIRPRSVEASGRRLTPAVGKLSVNRKPPESSKQDVRSHGITPLSTPHSKSLSVPSAAGKKLQPLRTSVSSPPRKQRRVSSCLPQDCRAKRTLTYVQPNLVPVKSSVPSLADVANKENWEHAGEVDIHKILQMLDRDMEADAAGMSVEDQETSCVHDELPGDCQQDSGLPPVMKTPVSEMEAEEQTTARQEIRPQDMGFPNPPGSNRCWMNATLQMLLGMEPFMEELERSFRKDGRNNKSALLWSFFQVVKHRRRGCRLSLHSALRHLSRSLGLLDAIFTSDRQQDATEFLVRLLDLFREHFSSSNSDLGLEDHKIKESCTLRELQLDNLPPGGSPAQRFSGGGRHVGGGLCNPVCDNVEFCLRETYCCTNCSEYTTRCQDHLALFLDIPSTSQARPSLQEALNRYMQSDVRELKCGRCSGQHSKVVTAFTKLPRFLLVQVKRYVVQMAIPEKLTSLVRVPIILSVKNCVSDDVIMPAFWLPESSEPLQLSLDDDEDKELQEVMCQSVDEDSELQEAIRLSLEQQQLMLDEDCAPQPGDADVPLSEVDGEDESPDYSYRLVCVVMHQGISPNCGHYVADVFNLEQQQWYHYDDDEVSRHTQDEVVGSARQRNGYIFCYMHRQLFNQLTDKNAVCV